ncbi:hypothetical protein Btru_056598 [Bulinus truncatus]|nr:hypothetical protein Btru_056598 [Bulinus truncatus]
MCGVSGLTPRLIAPLRVSPVRHCPDEATVPMGKCPDKTMQNKLSQPRFDSIQHVHVIVIKSTVCCVIQRVRRGTTLKPKGGHAQSIVAVPSGIPTVTTWRPDVALQRMIVAPGDVAMLMMMMT